jgi:hypothetical protein
MKTRSSIALALAASLFCSAAPPAQRRRRRIAWPAMRTQVCRMRRGTASPWMRTKFHSSIHGSLNAAIATPPSRSIPIPTRYAGEVRDLPRRRGGGAGWQRACLPRRASLHQLPWRRPFHLSQGRSQVGGLSAQRSAHLRRLPRQRRDGQEAWPAQRLSDVYGLHPRLCAQQGGAAGGGKLPELPWIASHPEPQGSAEPHLQGQYSQDVRKLPRGNHRELHGRRAWKGRPAGNLDAPVCSDCHTAHAIEQPTARRPSACSPRPSAETCHKDKFSTYRDTFHSQLGSLGGYVETARCWDCHGAHDVLPASDPRSPVNKANLVPDLRPLPCGRQPSFVQYQPHANARNRKLNPALYFIRLFMNLLLASVLTFFMIHTVLWLIRSRYDQIKKKRPQKEARMPDLEQAAEEAGSKGPRGQGISCASRGAEIPSRRPVHHVSGTGGDGLPMRFSESAWARLLRQRRGRVRRHLFFHKFCAVVLTWRSSSM